LVGIPEGKRQLAKPRRTWKDNIRMGLREIGWEDMSWTRQAQGRGQGRALVDMVTNLWVAYKLLKLCKIRPSALQVTEMSNAHGKSHAKNSRQRA
jgi:hypothetical protein